MIPTGIPSDLSPGPLRPMCFGGVSILHWRRVEVGTLIERIMVATEGTEGLDEVREIAARKSKEAIHTLLSPKNATSLSGKIAKIKEYMESIIICRHFIFPATFFRIQDFVENELDAKEAELVQAILQQQEQLQTLILQYGYLSSIGEREDSLSAAQKLLKIFKKLPKNKQPTSLIEALENPETHEKTLRQIRFFYKALKEQGL